jgi:hypothetical protein
MLKLHYYSLDANVETKDLLLVGVWHSIELILFQPYILGVGYYVHVDGSILLRFSCSGFTLILFCRCVLSLPPDVSHF